ncbi:MAG: hypothetical protein JNM93_14395 [Bacteriovoracaceae bacterium]|nr:hypothetical protein [Bacteriovoracaceae bacterium]
MIKFFLFLFFLTSYVNAASTVKVGAYINDIHNMELSSHSYKVDFYLWFKWQDKAIDPSVNFEFMNPFELWGHTTTKSYEEPIRLPNGDYYQVIRVIGGFTHKFDLKNYPFDTQYLTVEFEPLDSIESHTFEIDTAENIKMNPEIKFPGFILGSPELEVVKQTHATDFGDIREKDQHSVFTRVKVKVPIKRPIITYMVKLILPILCVVFSTCLMFLFRPTYVDARVGIGITSLLTIVALQITLNDELPEIDYLVLMDKIYILTYIFIVIGLAIVVYGSWIMDKGEDYLKKVIALDRKALIYLISFYLFALLLLLVQSLINR